MVISIKTDDPRMGRVAPIQFSLSAV